MEGHWPFHKPASAVENTGIAVCAVAKSQNSFLQQTLVNLLDREYFPMKKQAARHSTATHYPGNSWHTLYQAALFETDRSKVPARITEAEKAILSRVRELFGVEADHIEEDQILDDALYALRALRHCVVEEANVA